MSWHCSQELAAAFLQAGCLDIESYVLWKKIRTAERSSFDDKNTKKSKPSPYGTISTLSMGNLGMASLMSSLLASPVRDSALLVSGKAKRTTAINGQKLLGSSRRSNLKESSLRMFPESNDIHQQLSQTLPIWGMIQGGELYPLEKPEPYISGKDGGLWPTPTSSERSGINPKTGRGGGLSLAVKGHNWPTPTVSDSGGGVRPAKKGKTGWYNVNKDGTRWGAILRDAVPAHEKKWPTPTASDHKGKNSALRKSTGKVRMDRLDHVNEKTGGKERLNPDWVEWLMGWPIGWTSLDPLDTQLALWWKIGISDFTYWEKDPAEEPHTSVFHTERLTNVLKHRADRLRCCGNGQVPQQVLLALNILQ